MKRKLFAFVLLMIMSILPSFGITEGSNPGERKQFPLATRYRLEKRGRTAIPILNAYNNCAEQVIEIESSGLSDAEVIILDSDNNVVECQSTIFLDYIQVAMPQEAGTYYLTISSEELVAEGVFVVY